MYEHNYFPRNADGTLKKKEPCKTAGCKMPNYHVCLVGKPDTFDSLLREEERIVGAVGTKKGGRMPESQKAAIAESQRIRQAAIYEANYDRDMHIQDVRSSGASVSQLARQFGISKPSIRKALQRPVREFL